MRITPQEGDRFKLRNLSVYEQNSVCMGEHYSGKSHFIIHKHIKPCVDAGVNLWFWDHHGQIAKKYHDIFDSDQIVYYLDDLQYGTQCYVPESKSEEHFNKFCELVAKQTNLHVYYDELHNYCTAQRMADGLKPIIRDLASNQGVTYTAIFQRASEIHKAIISNAKYKFLFAFDPLDEERYLRTFGMKASLLLEQNERQFYKDEPNCKEFSFVYKDDQRSNQTEFYNGGIFYEPKTAPVRSKNG